MRMVWLRDSFLLSYLGLSKLMISGYRLFWLNSLKFDPSRPLIPLGELCLHKQKRLSCLSQESLFSVKEIMKNIFPVISILSTIIAGSFVGEIEVDINTKPIDNHSLNVVD